MNQVVDTHTLQLQDLHRHLEDFDNRGKRHILRIHGLPELVEQDQLLLTVVGIFKKYIHHALRTKGRESDPPQDMMCCLVSYQLKEEIL